MRNKTALANTERAKLVTLLTTVRQTAELRSTERSEQETIEAYFRMLDSLIERFGRESMRSGHAGEASVREAQRAAARLMGRMTEQLFGWTSPRIN